MPNPENSRAETAATGPLPEQTITWVWDTISLRYGRRFLGIWDGLDLGKVQRDWAWELRFMSDEQLAYALDRLPPDPPANAIVFRGWCRSMPEPGRLKLPPARGKLEVPAKVQAELARLAPKPDDEPQEVRAARRRLELLQGRVGLSPVHLEAIAAAERVISRHEAGLPAPDDTDEADTEPPLPQP
jgi:hypothetical protein